MTPLPAALGGAALGAWRLDQERFAPAWDSGEGAFRQGGRWNSKRVRAVYCAVDPSTAILEVAVHKGFEALDRVRHVITFLTIDDPAAVRIVAPDDVPNPNWLVPGIPSASQQQFGDGLLASHAFIVIPSTVSRYSWNLVFDADRAKGLYRLARQERFALDGRLNPPAR